MNGALGFAQLAVLAVVSFMLLAAGASAALYPMARSRLEEWSPSARSRALLLWSAAPPLAGIVLVGACLFPSALAVLGVLPDHCGSHDDGHAHLCVLHLPATAGSAAGWMLIVLVGLYVVLGATRKLAALAGARKLLRSLVAASRRRADGARVLDCARPISLAVGVSRPEVLLSSGLIEAVPEGVLDIVLAHERAHVRRRDAARRLLASFFSMAHFPHVRRLLLEDLALACEQACDEEAAEKIGDRLRVADAIVKVERVIATVPLRLADAVSSFGGGNVGARVEALLDDRPRPRGGIRHLALGLLAVVAALALAEPIHHLTETVLGHLVK